MYRNRLLAATLSVVFLTPAGREVRAGESAAAHYDRHIEGSAGRAERLRYRESLWARPVAHYGSHQRFGPRN